MVVARLIERRERGSRVEVVWKLREFFEQVRFGLGRPVRPGQRFRHQEMEPGGRRVLILQRRLPEYRVPFFESLRARLGGMGIDLDVVHGTGSPEEVARGDEGHLEWAACIETGNASFGSLRLTRHSLPRALLKSADLIIVPVFEDSVELFHCLPSRRFDDPLAIVSTMPLIYVPELTQSQEILVQLQKRRVAASQLITCSSLELVKSLVVDEVGVGILPRRVAEHGVRKRLRSLSPPLPRYRDRIALVRRYDAPPTAAIRPGWCRSREW